MSTLALASLVNAAKVKTWSHVVNQTKVCANQSASFSAAYFELKTRLLTIPGATVKGSSDGTTAAMDGIDRIGADPGVLTNTPNRWIVINVDTMSGSFEFLINWGTARSYISPNGLFTGGSTTTRPTATDEDSISDNYPNSANTFYTHFISSSDGKSLMFFTTGANLTHTYLMVLEGELCSETANSLDTVWFSGWSSQLNLTFPTTFRAYMAGALVSLSVYGGPYFAPAADAKTAQGGTHIAHEFGLGENGTPDGLLFTKIFDLYKGGTSLAITGDGAPSGGSREWLHFGNIIVPWNGAVLTVL